MKSLHSNNLLQHPLSVPLLLIAVILAVYYPALLGGIHPVDDPGIVAKYSAPQSFSSLLFPGKGYYYRPIVELSFYLDNLLWGMEPGIMHLENILIHCANSLMVLLLARRYFVRQENKTMEIPLLVALLFALHPLNVEAVAWIAGRTDPLLALFVLSSFFYILRWLDKPCWQDMAAALLMFCAALLTKETALAFGVVVILIVMTCSGSATVRQRLTAAGILVGPALLLVIFALLFRSGASGLNRFLSGTDLQAVHIAWQALIALGFYAKKLIFPFPLNFAINNVHPLNVLFALALFPLLWWAVRRYRRSGVLFIAALLLVMPALLVAVKQVAWTLFAERYMYLPSAFLVLGLVGVCENWQRKYPAIVRSAFVIMLCGSALVGFQRNLLWKDPFSFFEDAVTKSPEFGSVYYSLGGLLIQKGDIGRATEAFAIADRLNKRDSMRYPIKSAVMGTMLAKGNYLEARTYYFQLFNNKKDAPDYFLELLFKADNIRFESLEKDGKILLAQDLLDTLGLLYLKNPDPFWLYRSGQIALAAGDKKAAVASFRNAYTAAPVDSHYKDAAKTYYLRLETEK